MLGKPKRKIDGHLIPHSSYLPIFGRLHRDRVAHLRIADGTLTPHRLSPHALTFNVSGHFRATGEQL